MYSPGIKLHQKDPTTFNTFRDRLFRIDERPAGQVYFPRKTRIRVGQYLIEATFGGLGFSLIGWAAAAESRDCMRRRYFLALGAAMALGGQSARADPKFVVLLQGLWPMAQKVG